MKVYINVKEEETSNAMLPGERKGERERRAVGSERRWQTAKVL